VPNLLKQWRFCAFTQIATDKRRSLMACGVAVPYLAYGFRLTTILATSAKGRFLANLGMPQTYFGAVTV
jgi:hypothetical protein